MSPHAHQASTHPEPGDDLPAVVPPHPTDDRDAVVIPLRRTAFHNHIGNPEAASDEPVWRYSQYGKRRGERHFSGHVRYVRGPQAERLRSELAGVLVELLDWAAQHRDDDSTESGAAA